MLPPGKDAADKYYVGFFDHEALVAVMDFVLGYPDPDVAFIGFLMVDSACQGQGIGSQIVADCAECWRKLGFRRIRLGVDKGNPQSGSFWKKNGFAMVGENRYIVMEQRL